MEELTQNVLNLLYIERAQIIKRNGWSEHKIRNKLDRCDKSEIKLAIQSLLSKKYIDKIEKKDTIKFINGMSQKVVYVTYKISLKGIEVYEGEVKNMEQNKTLKEMVEKDISEIEMIDTMKPEERMRLHSTLTAKYHSYIPELGNSLYGYIPSSQFYDVEGLGNSSIIDNLNKIKAKLEMFKITGCQINSQTSKLQNQSINIYNSNSLENEITITISFDKVREKIENMTSIGEEELKEINDKIDNIEEIMNSQANKRTKWSRVAPILKWIADKGVDVGIALLPLILKI